MSRGAAPGSRRPFSRIAFALLAACILGVGTGGGCSGREDAVTLKTLQADGFDGIVKSLRGRVVLVDFWATWCVPCRLQFPHTAALDRKLRSRGLAVISVSLDDPAERGKVLEFLEKEGATFSNFINARGADAESFDAFGIDGVPHYKLYDRKGKLRREFFTDPAADTQFTPQDIDRRVEELLEES